MLKTLIDRYKKSRNPVKYWRSLGAKIGEDCEIYSSASLGGEPYLITVGDKVRINSNVIFVTHDGGVWVLRNLREEFRDIDKFGKIATGNNVHIGVGAVVTRDIPDNSIAVGVPARVIKTVEEYAEQHKSEFFNTKHMTPEEKREYLLNNIERI